MKQAGRLLLIACALLSAAPAAARPQPPNKVEKVEMAQLDRVYLRFAGSQRTLRKLMACLAARDESAARKVFDYPYSSKEQSEALGAIFQSSGNCLGVSTYSLKTGYVTAIGALADILIDKDGTPVPERKEPVSETGSGDFAWTWNKPSRAEERAHVPIGFCLVGRYPAKVGEVLLTEPVTNSERGLLNSMTSEIRDCVPAGEKAVLNPIILRATMAVGYYAASRKSGLAFDAEDGV